MPSLLISAIAALVACAILTFAIDHAVPYRVAGLFLKENHTVEVKPPLDVHPEYSKPFTPGTDPGKPATSH